MTKVEKIELLKKIIETADDGLLKLLIEIAEQYNETGNDFSNEDIDFLEARRDAFYKNGKHGFSVDEIHQSLRKQ